MSIKDLTEQKKQTTSFTTTGHAKVKEMAKRYGINQFMMLDAMIYSVDEQSKEFLERVDDWRAVKGAKKSIDGEMAAAVNEVTRGMSPEEVKALLEKAKELQS